MSTQAARKAWNEAMKATAGAALPVSLQHGPTKRRSGRNNKQERRTNARRMSAFGRGNEEYRAAVWMDALEGVDITSAVEVDDEEFDELEDLQGKTRKRKKRTTSQSAGVLPKKFLPRSLASIILEEANKEHGASRDFLNAEARLPTHQQLPLRKFCPVTGAEGTYRDPKSNVCYANLSALEQIQERSPPWMSLGGAAAFYEAAKSIRDDAD